MVRLIGVNHSVCEHFEGINITKILPSITIISISYHIEEESNKNVHSVKEYIVNPLYNQVYGMVIYCHLFLFCKHSDIQKHIDGLESQLL